MMYKTALLACTLIGALPFAGQARPLASEEWVHGIAQVIDGDSIRVDNEPVRLYGIDAFEPDQTCESGSRVMPCGKMASDFLSDMIEGQEVRCRVEERDAYDRILGSCIWNARNINEIMVVTGHALAWGRHTQFYFPVEDAARSRRAGMWSMKFDRPEDWRVTKDIEAKRTQEEIIPMPSPGYGRSTPIYTVR